MALLSNLRSNDRIYLKAFSNDQSLLMKGQFLSSLHASCFRAFFFATIGSGNGFSARHFGKTAVLSAASFPD